MPTYYNIRLTHKQISDIQTILMSQMIDALVSGDTKTEKLCDDLYLVLAAEELRNSELLEKGDL